MLFPSNEFLLVFLPGTLALFLILRRWGSSELVVVFLVIASLIFYSWTNPLYLPLILASMIFNYAVGLSHVRGTLGKHSTIVLGVTINLLVLGWFKYSGFLARGLQPYFSFPLPAYHGDLPLAISFFTFLQIAYVVDVARARKTSGGLWDYFLFVTFFPHLIAGPLVHHRELIPQFKKIGRSWQTWQASFAVGITIFVIGLFKKLGIADAVAPIADQIFDGAKAGDAPTLIPAWLGTTAYALQIYFDFSGYSDMAIGLSKMFCLRLPINFNSPYQADSIIDFWKRWHITLSRFLMDYLYIPLGGNRSGPIRRYVNIMIVMVLGGLWHGAGLQFIVWGALHGIYLLINHLWRSLFPQNPIHSRARRTAYWGLTMLAVLAAWVPFRAADLSSAALIWKGMFGFNGVALPSTLQSVAAYVPGVTTPMNLPNVSLLHLSVFAIGALIATAAPNIYRIVVRNSPVLNPGIDLPRPARFQWRPTVAYAIGVWLIFVLCLVRNQENSPFLYFQF